jgi:hypothetical protein
VLSLEVAKDEPAASTGTVAGLRDFRRRAQADGVPRQIS